MRTRSEKSHLLHPGDENWIFLEISGVGHSVLPLQPLLAVPDLFRIQEPFRDQRRRRRRRRGGGRPLLDHTGGLLGNVDASQKGDLGDDCEGYQQRDEARPPPPMLATGRHARRGRSSLLIHKLLRWEDEEAAADRGWSGWSPPRLVPSCCGLC